MTQDRELRTDEADFLSMMQDQDPVLARWVLGKLRDGKDPHDITYLLCYYAQHTRGWCTGRYPMPQRREPSLEERPY